MFADRGFTLLEMLLVLSILAMLAAIGVAAGQSSDSRARLRHQTQLAALLAQAQSEALEQGTRVGLVRLANRITTTHGKKSMPWSAEATLEWTPMLNGLAQELPAFFSDGSATPGVLVVIVAGESFSLRIDWAGIVNDSSIAR